MDEEEANDKKVDEQIATAVADVTPRKKEILSNTDEGRRRYFVLKNGYLKAENYFLFWDSPLLLIFLKDSELNMP